jgi:1-acyl-sn-glycerol-3-phosphate acyltransferase
LQFRGPSATSGYFRNAAETARLFDGDWLESGDLAYMAAGEVYITGRTKDVIIRGGRNIYPSEVEEAVAEVEGIQKGNVAVFGSPDPEIGTERPIVLAETRKSEAADQEALRGEITALVTDLTGTPPDDVVLAPLRTVPKTSSGKIRRAASREIYERGRIGAPARALWWQVLRVAVSGALPGLRRLGAAAADGLFAGYVLALAGMLVVPLWLGVVLPARTWRWRVVRLIVRLLATAAGVPLAVRGLDNLPPVGQACILVSNHMSYLDGLLLATAIPRELRFIAKVELRDSWVMRLPLDRLGAAYVERFGHRQGVDDAGRIAASAADGPAPLFFAEGTFTRAAGLLPFQMGAFIAAATGGVPVVPVAIRGTRAILRGDSWFPRRGAVAVTIGAPVSPEGVAEEGAGDPWAVAIRLRDAARAEILRHCGEPDLVGERPEIFAGVKMSV